MIQSFHCAETQALFKGERIARFANIQAAAMRKLALIAAAATVDMLRAPPGNRLEALNLETSVDRLPRCVTWRF